MAADVLRACVRACDACLFAAADVGACVRRPTWVRFCGGRRGCVFAAADITMVLAAANLRARMRAGDS